MKRSTTLFVLALLALALLLPQLADFPSQAAGQYPPPPDIADVPTAAAYRSPGSRHKVEVADHALARELEAEGGRVIGDYGSYVLMEVDTAAANTLATQRRGAIRDEYNLVLLNSGEIDTANLPSQIANLRSSGGKQMRLVQFAGPVKPEWYAALVGAGVEIITYIPNNAYLVYGDGDSLARVRSMAAVQWQGDYREDHKLGAYRDDKPFPGTLSATGHPYYEVQLYKDAATTAATLQLIGQLKTDEIKAQWEILHYINLVVGLRADDAKRLVAARPDVVTVVPYVEPELFDERQGQILANNLTGGVPNSQPSYNAFLAARGFTQAQFNASNIIIDNADSGLDNGTTSPNHFGLYQGGARPGTSRVVYNKREGTASAQDLTGCGGSGHGTWTAHVIAGHTANMAAGFPHSQNSGGGSFYDGHGINPFARLGSSVFFTNGGSFTSPNIPDSVSEAYMLGARITSNSWGAPIAGAYNANAQTYDALVRDAQPAGAPFPAPGNQEMIVVFAAGNSGAGVQTMGSPASAKNVITAGGSQNYRTDFGDTQSADNMYSSSSRGPCADGRIKPDLLAPATKIAGGVIQVANPPANGDADSCYAGGSFYPAGAEWYRIGNGTSFACPAVSGGASLVRQFFINHQMTPPSPALTKAWLMNSATYMTGAGAGDTLPSNNQGMGRMNLDRAFEPVTTLAGGGGGTARIIKEQSAANTFTASGQLRLMTGVVDDPAKPFRVTLAWTDPPGPTSGAVYINNLDLEVTVGGNTYKGNVFSAAHSATGGNADTRNNAESVFLPAGVTGAFVVRVRATNIAGDGVPNEGSPLDQDFALVVYNGTEQPAAVIQTSGSQLTAEGCAPANFAADPGETVTMDFSLQNAGTLNTTNLVATLIASGGVNPITTSQPYGALTQGGAAVTRPFQFTVTAACGGLVTATLQLQDGAVSLGTVQYTFRTGVLGTVTTANFSSGNLTTPIQDNTTVSIPIAVMETGLVTDVRVSVRLNHTFDGDLNVSLVGPDGTTVDLSSGNGGAGDNYGSGAQNCAGTPTVFDDAAATAITSGSAPFAGSFRPEQPLSVFDGKPMFGTWTLRVTDIATQDTGTLYCFKLDISSAPASCCGDCAAPLSPTGRNLAANGGAGTINVNFGGSCQWTAASNVTWIAITSGGSGTGAGVVGYSVDANPSNASNRAGIITVGTQAFTVRQGANFLDVQPGHLFYNEIGKLSAVGVTQGCGGGNYCPAASVTREQMAAFIIRALGDFNPPPPGSQRFADVPPSNIFYAFIEQMAVRQITLGCGGGNYCPGAAVTREQMAAFIIRALHAPGYVPPPPGSQRFLDVPPSNIFYAFIEQMAVRQITLGCGGGNYCPAASVTREQMAAFLVRAFNL